MTRTTRKRMENDKDNTMTENDNKDDNNEDGK